MISISEAREIIKNCLPEPVKAPLALGEAMHKLLAEDVFATEPSPRFTNSAMDGFAVCWEDVQNASEDSPVELKIVGESQAGIPYEGKLQAGEAARISTGAMLCDGADTIVPVEHVIEAEGWIRVGTVEKAGQHVRHRGEEFDSGTLLLPAGTALEAPQLALLASQGIASAPVYQKPGVAVIVTGTELVRYYSTPKEGQIRDSNGLMLSSAATASGADVLLSTHVGDDYDATVQTVRKAMENARVIIFSGGVSVGPHDLVKKAAGECGFEERFWKVSQKPGKPLFFAEKEGQLFFGLPGNPVSAYMCYLYYIDPVLRFLQGSDYRHKSISALAGCRIENTMKRAHLLRVTAEADPESGKRRVMPLKQQGSHMLTSLTRADGFIVTEPGQIIDAGSTLDFLPFHS